MTKDKREMFLVFFIITMILIFTGIGITVMKPSIQESLEFSDQFNGNAEKITR